jgi:hypothetical protein
MLKRFKGQSSTVCFQEIKDAVLCGLNFRTFVFVAEYTWRETLQCKSKLKPAKTKTAALAHDSRNLYWTRLASSLKWYSSAPADFLKKNHDSSDISYYLQPLLFSVKQNEKRGAYIIRSFTRNRRWTNQRWKRGAASTEQSTSITKHVDAGLKRCVRNFILV